MDTNCLSLFDSIDINAIQHEAYPFLVEKIKNNIEKQMIENMKSYYYDFYWMNVREYMDNHFKII